MAVSTAYPYGRRPERRLLRPSIVLLALVICLESVESAAAFSARPFLTSTSTGHTNVPIRRAALQSTSASTTSASDTTATTATEGSSSSTTTSSAAPFTRDSAITEASTIWEKLALNIVPGPSENILPTNPEDLKQFCQAVTLLRVGAPALLLALSLSAIYTPFSLALADFIDDSGVFSVVSQDSSQYIQNILTTCGLTFSLLVGQTYYFMYQQTESIYLALFEEVTVAKSLLEQVSLVSQGRDDLNRRIITAIRKYVQDDLRKLQDDPAVLLSARPMDDPLESIMYLTSVGEPSVVYESVRALRQARAYRLGALQRKLPEIQMILLWSLAGVVLSTFPLLGAGVQTIGGMGILKVQSIYLTFIVFGIALTMGVINELRKPAGGAYNVDAVLNVMVGGLEEELDGRLNGRYRSRIKTPSIDSPDGDASLPRADYGVSLKDVAGMEEDDTIIDDGVNTFVVTDSNDDGDLKEDIKPWIGKRIVRRIKNRRRKNKGS